MKSRGGLTPPARQILTSTNTTARLGLTVGTVSYETRIKRDRLAREGFFDLHKKGPPRAWPPLKAPRRPQDPGSVG